MPSGKQSRKQRRVPTPPAARTRAAAAAGPRRRQASPKVLIGAGAAVVLAVVAVVLAVVLTGGSSSSLANVPTYGSVTNPTALPEAQQAQQLFAGIPQHGNVLGSPKAPVTMVEYVDLQCPYCQQFETQVMPGLVAKYVRTGKVRVEARILDFIGPDSSRGRKAMIAAGQQNRAFNFAELLYYNQGTENTGWLDENMVAAAAASIPGLNVHRVLADRNSGSVATLAKKFDDEATADKVSGTPTILVGRTGSTPKQVTMASPTDGASVTAALDKALRGA